MKYLHNVATIALDRDRCTGCGCCTEVCPSGVLQVRESKAVIVDRDQCVECGACVKNCAFDALTVDAGVGCAAAMINGLLKYGDAGKGTCDCSDGESAGCC